MRALRYRPRALIPLLIDSATETPPLDIVAIRHDHEIACLHHHTSHRIATRSDAEYRHQQRCHGSPRRGLADHRDGTPNPRVCAREIHITTASNCGRSDIERMTVGSLSKSRKNRLADDYAERARVWILWSRSASSSSNALAPQTWLRLRSVSGRRIPATSSRSMAV